MKTLNVEIPTFFKQLLATKNGFVKAVEILNEVFSAYVEELAKQRPENMYEIVSTATMLKRQLLQMISDIFEGLDEDPNRTEVGIQDYTLEIFDWVPESPKLYFRTLMAFFDAYSRSDYGQDAHGEFLDMICKTRSSYSELLYDIPVALSAQEKEEVLA